MIDKRFKALSFIWLIFCFWAVQHYTEHAYLEGVFNKLFLYSVFAAPVWLTFGWRYLFDEKPIPKKALLMAGAAYFIWTWGAGRLDRWPNEEQALIAASYTYLIILSWPYAFALSSKEISALKTPPSGLGNRTIDADSMYHCGLAYLQGSGVEKNAKTALGWLRKAANQDHAMAQFMLGMIFSESDEVKPDYEEATRWLLKAAKNGSSMAQVALAGHYHEGRGVPQNLDDAYYWLCVAKFSQDELASAELKELYTSQAEALAEAISPAQRAETERRAKEWQRGDTPNPLRETSDRINARLREMGVPLKPAPASASNKLTATFVAKRPPQT